MKLHSPDNGNSELITASMQAVGRANEEENANSILKCIIDSSDDAIISKTLNGIITSWNNGAEKIFGYKPEEAIGKHISFIIPPDLLTDEQMVIDKISRGERVFHFETIRVTKNGRRINISLTVSPIKDKTGKIIGASKIARDITEQKQALAIIEKNEERFRQLVMELPAAVYSCDADGYVNFYNEAAAKVWGRRPEIGKEKWCGSWKLSMPDGTPLPIDNCPMRIAMAEKRPILGEELTIERPDGSRSIVQVFPQPQFGLSGQLTGAINMAMDITERKEAEKERLTLASIVNTSEDAIISKTIEGIITSWNIGAEKIFGYSPTEAIGKHVSFIIPKELHQEEQMVIDKIKKGEQVLHFETVRLAKDGKRINISLTVSPLRDQTGRIIGASKIARDITSQKHAQEILAKSEQALKESAQRLEDFIKIASHELKTPITTIKGYLQLLLRSAKEKEQIPPHFVKSSLEIMNKQVERLARLIGELLDMSKIESELIAMNKESFSLNELINETVQDLRYIYNENEINISHEFECNLFADKDRIGQVISNLVTNAIKYSPNRERIEIKIFRDNTDVVAVSVTDQGIGIETKDHQKIFERFYRTEGKYQQTYPGFGLGLYIVSEILSRHNGTINVQSEKGKGSTFTFKLPLE